MVEEYLPPTPLKSTSVHSYSSWMTLNFPTFTVHLGVVMLGDQDLFSVVISMLDSQYFTTNSWVTLSKSLKKRLLYMI